MEDKGFIYPELKKRLMFWHWRMGSAVGAIIIFLIAVIIATQSGSFVGFAVFVAFLICTYETDEATVLERMIFGLKFLILEPQHYVWHNQKTNIKNKNIRKLEKESKK